MLQSFTACYGHMIAGFEFAALETAYFSSRPGKPANMVFVGVGPWVQSFSGLSSIPETSTRKPSCAAPSKASIGPEGISAESSSGGKVSLFSPVLLLLYPTFSFSAPHCRADSAQWRHAPEILVDACKFE